MSVDSFQYQVELSFKNNKVYGMNDFSDAATKSSDKERVKI